MERMEISPAFGTSSGVDRPSKRCTCKPIRKYVCHSKRAISLASRKGWLPGARYTNLRDVKHLGSPKFLDIDWKNYDFERHLSVTKEHRPQLTIARDVIAADDLGEILSEADQLLRYSQAVAIVPKAMELEAVLEEAIPSHFILAYSVPTKYGGTDISTDAFKRPVHLLGGRPDVQRQLATKMQVISMDCNRFTFDPKFGDYFDGETFRPHPEGGYEVCISASLEKIDSLWSQYCACNRL